MNNFWKNNPWKEDTDKSGYIPSKYFDEEVPKPGDKIRYLKRDIYICPVENKWLRRIMCLFLTHKWTSICVSWQMGDSDGGLYKQTIIRECMRCKKVKK